LFGLAAVLALGGLVKADLLNYQISSSSSVTAYTDGSNGLAIDTAMAPGVANGTEAFSLDDGDSYTFDFFQIWTDESTINPDDVISQDITADLDFTAPPGVTVEIDGQTVGTDRPIEFRGHVIGTLGTGAEVTWDDVPPIDVIAGDREFNVSLSDTWFNSFLGFYVPGELFAGTVEATVTQISGTLTSVDSPAVAPLPASSYAGAALLAMLMLGRRALRRISVD
jgi:hypothetical protein